MLNKAAPDIEAEKMPENAMMIGNIRQPFSIWYVPNPKVTYISPAK